MEKQPTPPKGGKSEEQPPQVVATSGVEASHDDLLHPNSKSSNTTYITTPDLPPGKRRIRVQFELDYYGTPGMVTEGESLTEPEQSMTIRTMLQRASNGMQPQGAKAPIYFEQQIPVINDFTDLERYRQGLEERLAAVNQHINNEKQAAEAEAQAAKEAAELAKQQIQPQTPPA